MIIVVITIVVKSQSKAIPLRYTTFMSYYDDNGDRDDYDNDGDDD